jgi:hypothetical protein
MNRKLVPYAFLLAGLILPSFAIGAEKTLRVVVTGIDESGRSVIVSDGEPGLMLREMPGGFLGDLWKTDVMPTTNQDGYAPLEYALEPKGAGGISFRVAAIPPEKDGSEYADEKVFGMHQTDTIDFVTIISGAIHLRLEGGLEVLLEAGDTLIQRGTSHAWINRGDVPCVFSAVMVKPAIATPGDEPAAH